MDTMKRFKEICGMTQMTYDDYKAIQAEVVKNMEMLEADHKDQLRLALKEKEERIDRLKKLYFQQRTDFNNAVQDVEICYRSEIKAMTSVFKSKCVEQRNIRDMATTIFSSQFRYPEIPNTPAFTDDEIVNIEPDVELEKMEDEDDE